MTCRHWLIIAAGVLIAFGPCALVYNVWSIFVVPVSSSLGVASSQFTFFITLVYLVGGIAAPFAGNLLQKHDLRIVLSASVVMVALGLFLCSFWDRIYLFYVSGVLVGFGIVPRHSHSYQSVVFGTCGPIYGNMFRHVRGWWCGLEHGGWPDYRCLILACCLSGVFCIGSCYWFVCNACLRT